MYTQIVEIEGNGVGRFLQSKPVEAALILTSSISSLGFVDNVGSNTDRGIGFGAFAIATTLGWAGIAYLDIKRERDSKTIPQDLQQPDPQGTELQAGETASLSGQE